jgi:hypothetical protein
MASGADLKRLGWSGDGIGSNGEVEKALQQTPGIVQDQNGELHSRSLAVVIRTS